MILEYCIDHFNLVWSGATHWYSDSSRHRAALSSVLHAHIEK